MAFIFLAGGVVGILVGWWAKGTFSPASSSESGSGQQVVRGSIGEAVKVVALVALVAVVFLVMATSLVHGHR